MDASSVSSPDGRCPTAGEQRPLVGIGVPVFNGEGYLGKALDALLGQTIGDFEIVVSDNASTDGTRQICESYVTRDPRVRYIRQPTNIGLPRNWNFVARNSRGKYFKWASANDLVSPCMLEQCIKALEERPTAVLAFGRTQLIDAEDRPIRDYDNDIFPQDTSPSSRFREVCERTQLNNAISGVIRRSMLMQTGLVRAYPTSDIVLMAELALQGSFVKVDGAVFYRRADLTSITDGLTQAELMRLHDPASSGNEWVVIRKHRDLIGAALTTAQVPIGERLRSLTIALRHAAWSRAQMKLELSNSLRQMFALKGSDGPS